MTSETTTDKDLFTVVLVGAMNPALHHPAWYRSFGTLSDNEQQQAISRDFVFLPQLAQFRTETLHFYCDMQKWQLGTNIKSSIERVVTLTEDCFDKKLTETPLGSYGLNFNFYKKTECSNVGETLSKMLMKLPFGFMATGETTGNVSFTQSVTGGQFRCSIAPSRRDFRFVQIDFNVHYGIPHTADVQPVIIGKLIKEALVEVENMVEEQMQKVLDALNLEEKH